MPKKFGNKRAPKRKASQNTNSLLSSEKRHRSYSLDRSSGDGVNGEVRYLLPTKEKDKLTYRAVRENKQKKIDSIPTPTPQIETTVPLTNVELMCRRDELLKLRRDRISAICNKLIEDPYGQCKLLSSLIPFCTEQDPVVAVTVRKIGILSALAVVKDIMPGYKVRDSYEEEENQGQMLSKEVKNARTFETTFLSFYQLYLNILHLYLTSKIPKSVSVKTRSTLSAVSQGLPISSEGKRELSLVAMRCVCELLADKHHFNLTANLAALVVTQLANETPNRRAAKLCLVQLFQRDLVGEVSLEVVRRLADVIKKSYKLSPIVLQPLLHLPLGRDPTGALTSSGSGADEYHRDKLSMSRKEKKVSKLKRKVERDTRETRATESRSYISTVRSRIANIVFSIYIHVLKLERSGPLLSPALEGVSHFSHVISVEYFFDLLRYLSELLASPFSKLSFKQRLFCLHTSCTVLFSQHTQELNIDPKTICGQMYSILIDLPFEPQWDSAALLINTLQLMLDNSQCMHQERALGFAKRICICSLVKTPSLSAGLLFSIRSLLRKDFVTHNLLSNESLAGARYRPDLPDPDMCEAKSSCLWELSLLNSHFHPVVSKLAECLSEGSELVGKRNSLKIASDRFKSSQEIMEAASLLHTDPFDGILMCEQVESKKRKERVVKKYHTVANIEDRLYCREYHRQSTGELDFYNALSK